MWNKLTGKSSDASSSTRRRKDDRSSTSGSKRRPSESVVSSSSKRDPPREDDRPRRAGSNTSSYPPPEPSEASSYVTAQSRRTRTSDSGRSDRRSRRSTSDGDEDYVYESEKGRSTQDRSNGRYEQEQLSSRTERIRESDSDARRNKDRKRRSASGRADSERGLSTTDSYFTARSGESSAPDGSSHFQDQVSGAGFTQFPGQTSMPGGFSQITGGSSSNQQAPATSSHSFADPHVANQFPGQDPANFATPFRPPMSVSEGGPGLAADYYGDQGQSVHHQPGVRPDDPLINAQPHLMSPLAVAAPPQETGQGSAAEFYNSSNAAEPAPTSSASSKPPRPSGGKPGGKPSKLSGSSGTGLAGAAAAAAAGGAALYAMGHSSQQGSISTNIGQAGPSVYQQSPNGAHGASTGVPTAISPGPSMGMRPGNGPQPPTSSSNMAGYATGAAALATGAYAMHHQHSHSSQQNAYSGKPHTNGNYYPSGAHGPSPLPYGPGSGNLDMQHKHRGPVSRFVDWWKDYEDVAKMEEYTEYIGVCRDCFDPRSSAMDAPRKHHFHRKRSTESLRSRRSGEHRRSNEYIRTSSGRVDKESRYAYTSDNEKRGGYGSWVAAGIAGYGLGKVGKKLLGRNEDFDDTYSVKSGRRHDSRTSLSGRRRSRSTERSRTSYGVVRRDSSTERERKSRVEGSVIAEGSSRGKRHSRDDVKVSRNARGELIYERRRHSRSRSRSWSRDRVSKEGILGAAAGAAMAAGALGAHEARRHRDGSNHARGSTEKIYIHSEHDRERRHSTRGVGSSRISVAEAGAVGLGAVAAAEAYERRQTRRKKKRGFFNFGNGSTSSSDFDGGLVYGEDTRRYKRRSTRDQKGDKKTKRKSSNEKLNATLLGLGATAAALAAAQHGRAGRSVHSLSHPEVVAVKHGKKSRSPRRHEHERDRGQLVSHMASGQDEDDHAWEDVEEDASEDSYSGLVYGDFDYKGKGRKSTDSLVSNDSGTWKWGWRWGSKKNKRKPSRETLGGVAAPAAAAIAGAAAAGTIISGYHRDERRDDMVSAVSSQQSLQSVFPVQTSDPYSFDAQRRSDFQQPIWTSRHEVPPLQQPQPIMPVSSAMYSQPPLTSPSWVAPTGPPVDFGQNFSKPSRPMSMDAGRAYQAETEKPSGSSSRRPRRSSSPHQSTFGRNAVIAGVAAAATAGVIAASAEKNGKSEPSPSSVRFDLSKEHLEKEKKEQDRDRRRREEEEDTRRREKEKLHDDERRRRDEEIRLENDRRRRQKDEEEAEQRRRKRRHEEEIAATAAAATAAAALAARELEKKKERDREEAAREKARREDAERTERDRREQAAIARQRRDQERREAREAREAERRKRQRDDQPQRDADEREVDRRKRQHEEEAAREAEVRERDLRKREYREQQEEKARKQSSDWGTAAVAGLAGAAAGAAIASISEQRATDETRTRETKVVGPRVVEPKVIEPNIIEPRAPAVAEIRHVEPSKVQVDTFDDELEFDPDYFKKKRAAREAALAREAAARIEEDEKDPDKFITEFEERYSSPRVAAAEFFAPAILKDHTAEPPPRDPNADVDIQVLTTQSFGIIRPPYEPQYNFRATKDGHMMPWPVPSLKLIEPTPPGSRAGSVRGDVTPEVPGTPQVRPVSPTEEVTKASAEDPSQPTASGSKVTWGPDETFRYDVPTPESYRESYVSEKDFDSKSDHVKQADDEVIVEEEDGGEIKRTAYKPVTEPHSTSESTSSSTFAAAAAAAATAAGVAGVALADRTKRKEEEEDDVEEIPRIGLDGEVEVLEGDVVEAQSPEVEPVVIEPDERPRHSPFYQAPFFETVSDLNFDIRNLDEEDERPNVQHGYVEGEVFDETPKVEEEREFSMPGAFDDDEAEEEAPAVAAQRRSQEINLKSEMDEATAEPIAAAGEHTAGEDRAATVDESEARRSMRAKRSSTQSDTTPTASRAEQVAAGAAAAGLAAAAGAEYHHERGMDHDQEPRYRDAEEHAEPPANVFDYMVATEEPEEYVSQNMNGTSGHYEDTPSRVSESFDIPPTRYDTVAGAEEVVDEDEELGERDKKRKKKKRRSRTDDDLERTTTASSVSEKSSKSEKTDSTRRSSKTSKKSSRDEFDDGDRKSSKRRSKHQDDRDETSTVPSSSRPSAKPSRAAAVAGFFGFGSKSETREEPSKPRQKDEDDERERHRKKRSSSSKYGSDDENDSRAYPASPNRDPDRISRYSAQPPEDIVEDVLSHEEYDAKSDRSSRTGSKRNSRARDSQDQSFLGVRAEEAVPLPEHESSSTVESFAPAIAGATAAAAAAISVLMSSRPISPTLSSSAAEPGAARDLSAALSSGLVDPVEKRAAEALPESPPTSISADESLRDLLTLPASRPSSPIAVGSLRDLPNLPISRPSSPIEVGSILDLPDLPTSRPSSPIGVGSLRDLPDLPLTRPSSPIDVGSLRDLPTLPPSRPSSPIAVGSVLDLPELPTSRPSSPMAVGSVLDLPELPISRPSSPIDVGSVLDLPDLPPTRPSSPIQVGSLEDLPNLPTSRPSSPIDVGSLRDLPDLPTSRPSSPIDVGSLRDLPDLPASRPSSPIDVGSLRDLPDLPASRPSSPIEDGSQRELLGLPNSRPSSPFDASRQLDLSAFPASQPSSPTQVGSLSDLADLPKSRPTSPIEVGSPEGVPDLPNPRSSFPLEVRSVPDLPELPADRPGSPYEEPVTPQRERLLSLRAASTTSVPFRFRLPPSSPGFHRDRGLIASSPIQPSPSSPLSTQRPRHAKASSWDAKGATSEFRGAEFRPLYLLERNRQTPQVEEDLPPLPPSRETSRTPSVQDSEEESSVFHSAVQSPEHSFHESRESLFEEGDYVPAHFDGDAREDILDSQQTTPKASTFPDDVFHVGPTIYAPQPVYSPRALLPAAVMKDSEHFSPENERSGLSLDTGVVAESSRIELREESPTPRKSPTVAGLERLPSPSAPGERLSTSTEAREVETSHGELGINAALGAGLAGAAGVALQGLLSEEDSKDREPEDTERDLAQPDDVPPNEKPESVEESADTKPMLSRKASKKAKKGKKASRAIDLFEDAPAPIERQPTAEELREQDARDAFATWIEPQTQEPEELSAEQRAQDIPQEDSVVPAQPESSVPAALLQRKQSSKGKKKGKKGSKADAVLTEMADSGTATPSTSTVSEPPPAIVEPPPFFRMPSEALPVFETGVHGLDPSLRAYGLETPEEQARELTEPVQDDYTTGKEQVPIASRPAERVEEPVDPHETEIEPIVSEAALPHQDEERSVAPEPVTSLESELERPSLSCRKSKGKKGKKQKEDPWAETEVTSNEQPELLEQNAPPLEESPDRITGEEGVQDMSEPQPAPAVDVGDAATEPASTGKKKKEKKGKKKRQDPLAETDIAPNDQREPPEVTPVPSEENPERTPVEEVHQDVPQLPAQAVGEEVEAFPEPLSTGRKKKDKKGKKGKARGEDPWVEPEDTSNDQRELPEPTAATFEDISQGVSEEDIRQELPEPQPTQAVEEPEAPFEPASTGKKKKDKKKRKSQIAIPVEDEPVSENLDTASATATATGLTGTVAAAESLSQGDKFEAPIAPKRAKGKGKKKQKFDSWATPEARVAEDEHAEGPREEAPTGNEELASEARALPLNGEDQAEFDEKTTALDLPSEFDLQATQESVEPVDIPLAEEGANDLDEAIQDGVAPANIPLPEHTDEDLNETEPFGPTIESSLPGYPQERDIASVPSPIHEPAEEEIRSQAPEVSPASPPKPWEEPQEHGLRADWNIESSNRDSTRDVEAPTIPAKVEPEAIELSTTVDHNLADGTDLASLPIGVAVHRVADLSTQVEPRQEFQTAEEEPELHILAPSPRSVPLPDEENEDMLEARGDVDVAPLDVDEPPVAQSDGPADHVTEEISEESPEVIPHAQHDEVDHRVLPKLSQPETEDKSRGLAEDSDQSETSTPVKIPEDIDGTRSLDGKSQLASPLPEQQEHPGPGLLGELSIAAAPVAGLDFAEEVSQGGSATRTLPSTEKLDTDATINEASLEAPETAAEDVLAETPKKGKKGKKAKGSKRVSISATPVEEATSADQAAGQPHETLPEDTPAEQPKEADETDFVQPIRSKKGGKEGKKGRDAPISSTPYVAEEETIELPTDEVTVEEQPDPETIVPSDVPPSLDAQVSEVTPEEDIRNSGSKKKAKKGKKNRGTSIYSASVVEEEAVVPSGEEGPVEVAAAEELPVEERPLEEVPVEQQVDAEPIIPKDASATFDTEAIEEFPQGDSWASGSKKKGKKGKKNREGSSFSTPNVREKTIGPPTEESPAEEASMEAMLPEEQPDVEAISPNDTTATIIPEPIDENRDTDTWDSGSKKKKKGKKGQKTQEASTPIAPPVEERISELPTEEALVQEHSPSEAIVLNDTPASFKAEAMEEILEADAWTSGSKKKGKKGQKSKRASVINKVPTVDEPPPLEEELNQDREAAHSTESTPREIEGKREFTPVADLDQQEPEENWAPKPGKKGKRGKKSRVASLPVTPPIIDEARQAAESGVDSEFAGEMSEPTAEANSLAQESAPVLEENLTDDTITATVETERIPTDLPVTVVEELPKHDKVAAEQASTNSEEMAIDVRIVDAQAPVEEPIDNPVDVVEDPPTDTLATLDEPPPVSDDTSSSIRLPDDIGLVEEPFVDTGVLEPAEVSEAGVVEATEPEPVPSEPFLEQRVDAYEQPINTLTQDIGVEEAAPTPFEQQETIERVPSNSLSVPLEAEPHEGTGRAAPSEPLIASQETEDVFLHVQPLEDRPQDIATASTALTELEQLEDTLPESLLKPDEDMLDRPEMRSALPREPIANDPILSQDVPLPVDAAIASEQAEQLIETGATATDPISAAELVEEPSEQVQDNFAMLPPRRKKGGKKGKKGSSQSSSRPVSGVQTPREEPLQTEDESQIARDLGAEETNQDAIAGFAAPIAIAPAVIEATRMLSQDEQLPENLSMVQPAEPEQVTEIESVSAALEQIAVDIEASMQEPSLHETDDSKESLPVQPIENQEPPDAVIEPEPDAWDEPKKKMSKKERRKSKKAGSATLEQDSAEQSAEPPAVVNLEEAPAVPAELSDGPVLAVPVVETLDDEIQELPTEEPVEAVAETPLEAPVEIPTNVSGEVLVEASVEVPVDAPIEAPLEEPIEASLEAPIEASLEAPLETHVEAPDSPIQAPVNVPSEAPIEASPEGEFGPIMKKGKKGKKEKKGRAARLDESKVVEEAAESTKREAYDSSMPDPESQIPAPAKGLPEPDVAVSEQMVEVSPKDDVVTAPKKGKKEKKKKNKSQGTTVQSEAEPGTPAEDDLLEDNADAHAVQASDDALLVGSTGETEIKNVPDEPEGFIAKKGKKDKKKGKKTAAATAASAVLASADVETSSQLKAADLTSDQQQDDESIAPPPVKEATEELVVEEPEQFLTKKSKKEKRKSKKGLDNVISNTPTPRALSPEAPVSAERDIEIGAADHDFSDPVAEEPLQPVKERLALEEVGGLKDVELKREDKPESTTQIPLVHDKELLKVEQKDSPEDIRDLAGSTIEHSIEAHEPEGITKANFDVAGADASRSVDVDFAATVGAGLERSGFDPHMILADPTFSRPSSRADVLEEPSYDELPLQASRMSSRRGSRRTSRRASVANLTERQAAERDIVEGRPPPTDDKEFAAVLAAGLQGAGFNPDIVREDDTFAKRETPEAPEAADIEGFSAYHYKPARGKNGKKKGKKRTSQHEDDPSSIPTAEGDVAISSAETAKEPVPDSEQSQNREIEVTEAEPQQDWDITVKKTRKKGKKSSKTSGTVTPGVPLETASEPAQARQDPVSAHEGTLHINAEESPDLLTPGLVAAGVAAAGVDVAGIMTAESHEESDGRTEPEPPQSEDATKYEAQARAFAAERSASLPTLSVAREEPPKSRVASLFPGLERVKRKAPPRQNSTDIPPKRLSTGHGEGAVERLSALTPTSPKSAHGAFGATGAALTPVPEPSIRSQTSAQDLATQAWGWPEPENRDSAVMMQETNMRSPESHQVEVVRDSGFHEAPMTPTMSRDLDVAASPKTYPLEHTRSKSHSPQPKSPIKVQVEVPSDWAVSVSQESPTKETSKHDSMESVDSLPRPSLEYTPRVPVSPPAVESTSRDRASDLLFQSSPSTRERPSFQASMLPAEQETNVGETSRQIMMEEPPSLSRGQESLEPTVHSNLLVSEKHDPFTPISHRHSPSVALDTIVEASPDSPLAKKSRPLSDVGGPEHGVKVARHLETPEHTSHKRPEGLRITPPHPRSSPRPLSPQSMVSMGELIDNREWPEVDEENETVGIDAVLEKSTHKGSRSASIESHLRRVSPSANLRSPSVLSDRSAGGNRLKSPDHARSASATSMRSASGASVRSDRSVRRVDDSPDLRSANKLGEAYLRAAGAAFLIHAATSADSPSIAVDKGKARVLDMEGIYEGTGGAPQSPMSPTRPPSVRKRQSLHIMDLETRLDSLVNENRLLQDAKAKAEQAVQEASNDRDMHATTIRQATEAVASRDLQLKEKDDLIVQIQATIEQLQSEIARLSQENARLTEQNQGLAASAISNERWAQLEAENTEHHRRWQESAQSLAALQIAHQTMSSGMEQIVRDEVNSALEERNAEIERLTRQLEQAMEQIKSLQRQIVLANQGSDFLAVRDEDYFDSACQQLCQHVQQWVLRFSKFSDNRACRLSSEIRDDKIEARLDDAILDGSDVDMLLADRVKRRDVFMSVVMSMIWEYVFTRYLFGMDREQRQKLKALEKTLTEVGPQRAVAQWRAITLTLLSRREAFKAQREQDTEAVVQEIYATLAKLLPPPTQLVRQIQDSLRNVMRLAVSLALEMRTQRAEYIMLPPLRPEYDTNGDLVQKVFFNAALMNERSGETSSNEELEERQAVVKIVLFPLVVKRGDDFGEGEDEIVVCPAQVLIAKPNANKKVVRVVSGAMDIDARHSMTSILPVA